MYHRTLELIILELLQNYGEIGNGRSLHYSVQNVDNISEFSVHIDQFLIPKDFMPPLENLVFPVLCGKTKGKTDLCLT